MKTLTICAVIVTYHPCFTQLSELLLALSRQVNRIVIIDNSTRNPDIRGWLDKNSCSSDNISILASGKNLGLGAAHNLGICYAQQHHHDFVLQFDQDSLPQPDMVAQLVAAYQQLIAQGHKVAAVGPDWIDKTYGSRAIYTQHHGYRANRQQCSVNNSERFIATDYLITSGCLIPLCVVAEVGYLNESLFIDFVDIEWGLRAKSKGYQSFGVCAATLTHALGDDVIKVLWRNIHYHSPLRHYYTFRNLMVLLRQGYLPAGTKINIGLRYLARGLIYPLIFKPRLSHLKMILLGLWHGLQGRGGPYQGKED